MHNMACCLTDYLILNGLIEGEKSEEYIYGFEVIFGKILNYGTLLVLACINHNLIPTMFFMASFFSLRSRTGGYHAKKPLNCYLGTFIIYIFVTKAAAPLIMSSHYFLYGVVVISGILIFAFSPVNHPNLDLDEEEIRQCRNSSRWLTILISICVLFFVWLDMSPVFLSYIVAGMGMDAGLLLLAKIIKQEVVRK